MNAPAPEPLTVVLTVGTDHHPFDRVVGWVDEWVTAHAHRVRLVAQVGTSAPATAGESHDLLDPAVLAGAMAHAAAVVCHGGPGTIIDARRAGVEPIVVPRQADLGEHVDDHQVRFTAWMAARGQLAPASSRAELHAALDRVLVDPSAYRGAAGPVTGEAVARRFGELVEALLS